MSGATEANLTALQGVVKAYPEKHHVITTKIEHKVIKETCEGLECDVSFLNVKKNGLVDLEMLES